MENGIILCGVDYLKRCSAVYGFDLEETIKVQENTFGNRVCNNIRQRKKNRRKILESVSLITLFSKRILILKSYIVINIVYTLKAGGTYERQIFNKINRST